MSLKRLGVALVASLALAAVSASSALATATTPSQSHWIVAETQLASGETREVKCSKDGTENLTLKGTVAGSETEITAGKVECISTPEIKQEGSQAIATGELKFSELSVTKPAGCNTAASITTKPLTVKLYREGSTVYELFEPTAGATGTFATVPLTGCSAEGEYPAKGSVFGETSNPTGVEAVDQTLTFSESIQNTAGGALTLGGNPIQLSGKMNEELVSGSNFGAEG